MKCPIKGKHVCGSILIFMALGALVFFGWFIREPAVGNAWGKSMGEWFLYHYQKPLLNSAMKECYMGTAVYDQTYNYTVGLRQRYLANKINSDQMWAELSKFNRDFVGLVQDKKTDCIQSDLITPKIRALQDVELDIATRYYSQYNRWEIYMEKVRIWISFHLFVDNSVPFEVPGI
jgi:hypothetical protein